MDETDRVPRADDVLAAIERTLDRATFKLGRLRTRNRGAPVSRDLTSIAYDVSAARHDIARLREQLDETRPEAP